MKPTRVLTIAAGAAAFAGWLAAASTPDTPVAQPVVSPADPGEERGARLSEEIERLHNRLVPAARPAEPSRNLFKFATFSASDRTVTHETGIEPAAVTATPSAILPAPPPLRLIGLAEEAGPEGIERTAIISSGEELLFVRDGDRVTARFRVSRISADVVELIDLDGTLVRLPLP